MPFAPVHKENGLAMSDHPVSQAMKAMRSLWQKHAPAILATEAKAAGVAGADIGTKVNRPFTAADDAKIRELFATGISSGEIGNRLVPARKAASVEYRCRLMGLVRAGTRRKTSNTKLPKETKEAILEARRQGTKLADIAAQFNVGLSTVTHLCNYAGLGSGSRARITAAEEETAMAMRRQGCGYAEIGTAIGNRNDNNVAQLFARLRRDGRWPKES